MPLPGSARKTVLTYSMAIEDSNTGIKDSKAGIKDSSTGIKDSNKNKV